MRQEEGHPRVAFLLSPVTPTLLSCHRQVDYLRYLAPRGVVAAPELQAARAAVVSGDDTVSVGRLDVPVEGVARRHVPERGGARVDQAPTPCQRHNLAQLAARHVVPGPVGQAGATAAVSADDARVVGGLYVVVEWVVSRYV